MNQMNQMNPSQTTEEKKIINLINNLSVFKIKIYNDNNNLYNNYQLNYEKLNDNYNDNGNDNNIKKMYNLLGKKRSYNEFINIT